MITARLLLLAAVVIPALVRARPPAASPDVAGLTQAVKRARNALTGVPTLWGFDATDVQWIFTDGRTHLASTQMDGRDTLHSITIPAGTTIANTAVSVSGRRWAMVVLNVSRAERATVPLLVHEAMHTFQPERLPASGATEAGAGGDLLDGAEGRAWLFLELRALAEALTTQGVPQRRAAQDAVRFRAHRDALAEVAERRRLDVLDQTEGLPEYTGLRLAGVTDSSLATRLRAADTLRIGWVRAIGYFTGPAYGFLLDRLAAQGWREAALRGTRLPQLLAAAAGPDPLNATASTRVDVYGGAAIFRTERARAAANAARRDSLKTRFVNGPTLRVAPGSLQISFDPNGQTPLGADGTVMTNFRWTTADGAEFVAAAGALVSPAWDWFQAPLDSVTQQHPLLVDGTLQEALTLESAAWRLRVPAGWVVARQGARVELRPPARLR